MIMVLWNYDQYHSNINNELRIFSKATASNETMFQDILQDISQCNQWMFITSSPILKFFACEIKSHLF